MVKILQAYNFARQQTYALNGDILAASLIGNNRIAISSAEQFIEIYDISGKQPQSEETRRAQSVEESSNDAPGETCTSGADERTPSRSTLATVGEVVQLIYCEAGKYLLTLEKEQAGSPVHSSSTISCTSSSNSNTVCSEDDTKMFVRIYANFWKFPDSRLNELPITIRIASMTTPKTPLVESIDVIELPLRSPPELVQCCQTSGNIIVSSRDRIYLYEYTQCVHENTQPRFAFIDFLPFKFFVQLNFVPVRLSLAENVIACLSHRYCVAFKVVDALASRVSGGQDVSCLDNDYGGGDEPLSESISMGSKGSASGAGGGVVSSSHSQQSCESDSLQSTSSGKPQVVMNGALPGRSPLDFNVAKLVNNAYGREFEPELRSQWDEGDFGAGKSQDDSQDITISPQRAADIKIKLVNEAKAMNVRGIAGGIHLDDASVQYDVRKLLQICIKTSENQPRVLDILRCMDLKAIYQRSNQGVDQEDDEYDMGNQQVPSAVTTFKHVNRRTLKSSQHQRCIGHALLVASSVDGFLYQFSAQGKWYSENEKPVACYSFTAPVIQVHINDYVVYAVTSESVETHTSRIGHKLFHNRFEYPSIGGLFPEESAPDVSSPIAVVGLAAFMHVQFVCVNREQLVLITNAALEQHKRRSMGEVPSAQVVTVKRNIAARLLAEAKAKHSSLLRSSSAAQSSSVPNEWTLYNLEVPKVECVIEDLEGIAESYRSASSCNFYDLMEEAHVMLRLGLTLQGERLGTERELLLRKMFVENCRSLADFSIRSSKQEVYLQATGFYRMCQLHLVDIFNHYIENFMDGESEEIPELAGLIYTVKLFLLSLGTDRSKSAFLNQTVRPYFTPARVIHQGYKQVPLSLEFLNMFIKHAPADIPQIMLVSPVVGDSMSGELINYLKYLNKLSPDENLLLAVTACRMSNYLLAQEIVSKSSRRNLATALIRHKNVLFDDSTVIYQRRHQQQADSHASGSRSKKSRRMGGKSRSAASGTPTPNSIVSFSDFCETILLANEQPALIEAISDAFIHALCIEHSMTLDVILQLFLNYIASHIGQKGYQTSQKVLVNILQVYFYDLYDVSSSLQPHEIRSQTPPQLDDDYDEECSSSRAPSLHSEADAQSLSSSCASSAHEERSASLSISNRQQRIVYDQLQEQQSSPFQKRNSNASLSQPQPDDDVAASNLKGLKILFRMYMGRLKALSDLITDLQSADIEQQASREEFMNLRMECISYMVGMAPNYCPKPIIRNPNDPLSGKLIYVPIIPDYKLPEGAEYDRHIKSYIRPIPCLLERPQYLNRLPPFERSDFSYPNKDDGEFEVRFLSWHNELLTLTLKIQSLLSSTKVDREIISEFLAFIQKTPHLMGIDSFLVIVLPKNLAINYLLSFCPAFLWQYGKSCGFTPKHWESLLRKILSKQEALPNWKAHITEILNNLVAELSFEELLQCFPSEVIQNRNAAQYFAKEFSETTVLYEHDELVFKTPDRKEGHREHMPMDNIDEDNVFELTLRKAVAKQRSIALRSMIESTGTQLFDATSNPMYNL
ncbi:uncharacterized protein LOC108108794 [Drosophila eugracilis]|uniref:uncharacterized protein LOC108108794 n=1 Tax=Drosophila eugracilis TaxID=29029 RepID=UPI001BD961CB|nr:uncharacterized protein LOC108108794 [Drosophila eugracilis]XP_041674174.1 uncharacterized protein LOC108108794 [Drosophila eugracilis]